MNRKSLGTVLRYLEQFYFWNILIVIEKDIFTASLILLRNKLFLYIFAPTQVFNPLNNFQDSIPEKILSKLKENTLDEDEYKLAQKKRKLSES